MLIHLSFFWVRSLLKNFINIVVNISTLISFSVVNLLDLKEFFLNIMIYSLSHTQMYILFQDPVDLYQSHHTTQVVPNLSVITFSLFPSISQKEIFRVMFTKPRTLPMPVVAFCLLASFICPLAE